MLENIVKGDSSRKVFKRREPSRLPKRVRDKRKIHAYTVGENGGNKTIEGNGATRLAGLQIPEGGNKIREEITKP